MKSFKYILNIFLLLILGCASENPLLVNPPSQSETVNIRFINLAKDMKPRTLSMENLKEIINTPYGTVSATSTPPGDSSTMIVKNGSIEEFRTQIKTRFIRNTFYTFLALPPQFGSLKQKPVDTLLFFSTTSGLIKKKNTSYLQIYNAFPDTTITFDLRIGCQNGTQLALSIPYRGQSVQFELPVDEISFSLVNSKDFSKGTMYKEKFEEGREYAFVIVDNNGTPKLMFLDQYDKTISALRPANIVNSDQQVFNINLVNFSTASIDNFKINDLNLITGLSAMSISDQKSIQTCKSSLLDKYSIDVNGQTSFKDSLSFDVLKNYQAFVFDSSDKKGNLIVLAKPYLLSESSSGKSVIRVINGNYSLPSITLSLGARNANNSYGYSSGELLASGLEYGKISSPVILEPGFFPLTLFTSYQPTMLKSNAMKYFEPNKKYFIIVYFDKDAPPGQKDKIAVIEENATNQSINSLEYGSFLQIINAMPGQESVNIKIGDLLPNAKIFNSFSLATIVEPGTINVTAAKKSQDITLKANQRGLLVIAGTPSNPQFIVKEYNATYADTKSYLRRILNASDIQNLQVRLNNDSSEVVGSELNFGDLSAYKEEKLEKKSSFLFGPPLNEKKVSSKYRIDDVYLVFGKTYNIIFGGNATNGYSAIIFQEY